jgi:hypothetical protein
MMLGRKVVLGDSDMGEIVRPGWGLRLGRWVRERVRRLFGRLHPVELMAVALAALVALASCRDRGPDPVVIVDPGPPFGKQGSRALAAHVLDDGSLLVLMVKPSE